MLDTQVSRPTQVPTAPSGKPPRRVWLIVKCFAAALLVMLIAETLRVFVGANLHTVLAGRCYRSAQPTAHFLETMHRDHGIHTIINLRDENVDEPWYQEEKEAADRLGIDLVNAGLSSKEMAPREDFRKFVQAMKDAREPILIHCANGNDRSGLASAVYLMMHTETSVAEARRQLSIRFGHIPWTKASCLSRILDNYEAWLMDNGWQHSPDHFYDWGMHFYEPEQFHWPGFKQMQQK